MTSAQLANDIEKEILRLKGINYNLPQILVDCAFRAASSLRMGEKIPSYKAMSATQASEWGDTIVEFTKELEGSEHLEGVYTELLVLGARIYKECRQISKEELDKLIGKPQNTSI